jgi:hypothetical protein
LRGLLKEQESRNSEFEKTIFKKTKEFNQVIAITQEENERLKAEFVSYMIVFLIE